MAMIYDDSGVKARPHDNGVLARRVDRVYAFWVVLEGGTWTLPFTVSLPQGREAIALFSGEEEARVPPFQQGGVKLKHSRDLRRRGPLVAVRALVCCKARSN